MITNSSQRPLVTSRRLGWFFVLGCLGVNPALGFDVTGTITDSSGNPIPGIRVEVWDEDLAFDDHLATVNTNAAGQYAVTITGGFGAEDPDIYILVDWKFQLLPAAAYSNHEVILLSRTARNDCAADPAAVLFTSKTTAVSDDHNTATNLVKDLQMNQAQSNLAQLRLHINEALDYYRNNRGTVSWAVNYDVKVNIRTVGVGSFFCRNNQTIYIASPDITGGGGGFVSDIYHEMGHLVHYFFNGNSLPTANCPSPHFQNAESEPGCALVEGWPSYVAELTDVLHGNDNKYQPYRDTANTHWRGDEASPTGRGGGTFESGEDVEGAVGGFWFGIHNDPLFGFPDNFRVMADDNPDNVFDFCVGFVADAGGSGTVSTRRMYAIMQAHGIVYNRARLVSAPFDEGEPPDAAPPDEGNAKEIDGITFLRGTVTTKFESVSTADLGVDSGIGNNKVKIGFKTAADDLNDGPAAFASFTPLEDFGLIFHDLELDTRSFGGSSGDGDWDVLIFAENKDGFIDNLLPTWVGDGNASVNTDEKYLKLLGAWYEKDRNPATNTVNEGKVIVDNAGPTIDPASFSPQ